jgi:hypothetical protein
MLTRISLALIVLVAGAALGLGLGLYLGWQVWPVEYKDTGVASLRTDYLDEYIVMVATSYSWDGDLARAQVRLQELDGAPLERIEATRVRLVAAGASEADLQRLNRLAIVLRSSAPSPAVTATATAAP